MPVLAPPTVTFRVTTDALVATLDCEGHRHRVRITAGGQAHLDDHDPLSLQVLHALAPDNPPLPCEQIEAVAAAGRAWLDRRLRVTAPKGWFVEQTLVWRSHEARDCCGPHDTTFSRTARREASRMVRNAVMVEPGAMLAHSRTVTHLAALHQVEEKHLRRVTDFLCRQQDITADPRRIPETSAARMRGLLPDLVTTDQVGNLWTVGVSMDFLAAVAEVHPTFTQVHGEPTDDWAHQRWATDYYRRVLDWWHADGVTADWLRQVHRAAAGNWPMPAPARHQTVQHWTANVLTWRGMDPTMIGRYLTAGVRHRLNILDEHLISPVDAAEFEALRRGGKAPTLGDWLHAGYHRTTAFAVVRASADARPLHRDEQREVFAAVQRLDPEVTKDRWLAVGALIRTPVRTARWCATGLSLDEIVTALAAGLSPTQAQRRTTRRPADTSGMPATTLPAS